jgi:AmmeMemoRadiSam system protein B
MGVVQGNILGRRNAVVLVVVCACVLAGVFTLMRRTPSESAVTPEFRSYSMLPALVEEAFAAITLAAARPDAGIVLVNHHLLASHLIARALSVVASDEPVIVVLVAPDHFASGVAPATSVIARWPTPFGVIEPAMDAINRLASRRVVHVQERPFIREHGITNITMFIRKAIPNASLVPIVVRDDASAQDIAALAEAIAELPGRVLVVGSFDFTHDATDTVARTQDDRSLAILDGGDVVQADGIAVDSVPGIRLLMDIARRRELRFTMLDMTNSSRVLGQPDRTDVTSYITGFWAP